MARTCKQCGAPIEPGEKFCGNCGVKIGPEVCPNCGEPLEDGEKFCGNCGTPVGGGPAPAASAPKPKMEPPKPDPAPMMPPSEPEKPAKPYIPPLRWEQDKKDEIDWNKYPTLSGETDDDKQSKGNKAGKIIGLVIGCLIGVLVILSCAYHLAPETFPFLSFLGQSQATPMPQPTEKPTATPKPTEMPTPKPTKKPTPTPIPNSGPELTSGVYQHPVYDNIIITLDVQGDTVKYDVNCSSISMAAQYNGTATFTGGDRSRIEIETDQDGWYNTIEGYVEAVDADHIRAESRIVVPGIGGGGANFQEAIFSRGTRVYPDPEVTIESAATTYNDMGEPVLEVGLSWFNSTDHDTAPALTFNCIATQGWVELESSYTDYYSAYKQQYGVSETVYLTIQFTLQNKTEDTYVRITGLSGNELAYQGYTLSWNDGSVGGYDYDGYGLNAGDALLDFVNNCNSQRFEISQFDGFTEDMTVKAKNAPYAHAGRKFNDVELQSYFSQFDWYYPYIEPGDFTDDMMSETARYNLGIILQYRDNMGY